MKTLLTVLVVAVCLVMAGAPAWGQTTYTSTTSGNWSTMTWSPGGTPGASDNVVIADGNTVAIDQGVTVANLTVGQGVSGTLTFDGVAARAVTVSGNITVSAGGTFITQAAGTFTNTLAIGGDLTNNGTVDMSRGGSSLLCTVTFNKAGDQAISGAGTMTRFRGVTLNKGAVSNRVVSSMDVTMAGSQLFIFTNGTWEQTAGTLFETSGSQTIAATGALIFSGSGSLNMAIAGSFAVNGTLAVNTSGTFIMGSGNNSITTVGTPTLTFTSGTVTILGRLTLTLGNTTINGATILIDQQATNNLGATSNAFECSGTANLTFVSGSVTIVDPNGSGDDTRTGRDLKLTSTGTMNLAGSTFYLGDGVSTTPAFGTGTGFLIGANANTVSNLVLRTGGTAGRNVLLKQGLSISGMLSFATGLLNLGDQNLTLGEASTINGASSSSYVVTNGTGSLRKTFAADGSFEFPVGDNTGTPEYSPVNVNLTNGAYASAYVAVNVINAKHPNNASTTDYLNRYWTVTQSGVTGFTCEATFHYLPADVAGSEGSIDLGQWNGTRWADLGASNPVDHTLSGIVTAFSDFTGGEPSSLPIQLASFVGHVVNGTSVQLDWTTLSEMNNYGFFVERKSSSEQNFTELPGSFIPGHGTTLEPQHYTFTDNTASAGQWFYRLDQVDLDGTRHLSDPIQVDILTDVKETAPVTFALQQNYPNPFNPSTEIKFSVEKTGLATLKVYNVIGQEMTTLFSEIAQAGQYYTVKLDASRFSSGIYFYKLESGQKNDMKRMLLLK